MTAACIIEDLRDLGIDVELGVKVNAQSKPSPEVEKLLNKLSENREDAINHLLAGKIFPLPDNTPHPFYSDRMKQIRKIFAVCYRMIEIFENKNRTEEQWKIIADYHNGKLDPSDDFAIKMHTICYGELHKQFKKWREENENS